MDAALDALFSTGQALSLCLLAYACCLFAMNSWETGKVWLSAAAAGIAVAAVALFSTDLLSGTAQTAVTTVASPSEFFTATTAVPITSRDSSLVRDGASGDPRSDSYQSEEAP